MSIYGEHPLLVQSHVISHYERSTGAVLVLNYVIKPGIERIRVAADYELVVLYLGINAFNI